MLKDTERRKNHETMGNERPKEQHLEAHGVQRHQTGLDGRVRETRRPTQPRMAHVFRRRIREMPQSLDWRRLCHG